MEPVDAEEEVFVLDDSPDVRLEQICSERSVGAKDVDLRRVGEEVRGEVVRSREFGEGGFVSDEDIEDRLRKGGERLVSSDC